MTTTERILDKLAGVCAGALILGVSTAAWTAAIWIALQANRIDAHAGTTLTLPVAIVAALCAAKVTKESWKTWR